MIRLPPKSTRTYTLFPYTTLFRSIVKLNVGGKRMDIRRSTATHFDDTPLAWICGGLWDFMLPKDMHGELCESCRSEEHTSELQSLMRISYAVFCLKKKKKIQT